jgi:hypothetical protein
MRNLQVILPKIQVVSYILIANYWLLQFKLLNRCEIFETICDRLHPKIFSQVKQKTVFVSRVLQCPSTRRKSSYYLFFTSFFYFEQYYVRHSPLLRMLFVLKKWNNIFGERKIITGCIVIHSWKLPLRY